MTHYAILGGGRLARHMRHYFSLLNLTVSCWTRDSNADFNSHSISSRAARLRATIHPASHVLLLVSDSAITDLLRRYPFLHEKTLLHCSGALSIPGVAGAHPLMTFSHELYTLEEYRRIPFMVDKGHEFDELLPGLSNPHFAISLEDKPRYHALCVMAGNFSQILWQAAAERFSAMGLPSSTLEPYLRQVVQNFVRDPDKALTGPLSRGDRQTIDRNLAALAGDPLEPVYRAFVSLYRSGQPLEQLQKVAQ
jgi:predicted short-subunit dehydrogenase-like oxidoreductase (DUF2520 family)